LGHNLSSSSQRIAVADHIATASTAIATLDSFKRYLFAFVLASTAAFAFVGTPLPSFVASLLAAALLAFLAVLHSQEVVLLQLLLLLVALRHALVGLVLLPSYFITDII
jgi:hypothetical protein